MISWMPSAVVQRPISRAGGAYTSGTAWKVVVHSTQGGNNFSGATAYHGSQSYPHFEVQVDGRVMQYLPIDVSAYALYDEAGGVTTNRAHAVQVEMAGYAEDAEFTSSAQLDSLARIILFVHEQTGMAMNFDLPFRPPYTHGLRLEGDAWNAYDGVCGHQHVGEGNDHTDPGLLPVSALKARLKLVTPAPKPSPEEDSMAVRYPLPTGEVYVTDGVFRSYVGNPAANDALNEMGVKLLDLSAEKIVALHDSLVSTTDLLTRAEGAAFAVNVATAVIKELSIKVDASGIAQAVLDGMHSRLGS